MLMKFTRDAGRYRKGEWRDWPQATWDGVARSEGVSLDEIAERVAPEVEGVARETRQMTERADVRDAVATPKRKRGRPFKNPQPATVEA